MALKRGRKAKPTARKRAEGNPGRRKLNAAEPLVPLELILPAYDLGANGTERWGELIRLGAQWITSAEAAELTDLANIEGWLCKWGPNFEALPPVVREMRGKGGAIIKTNPALAPYRQQMNLARLLRSHLGFDPASRQALTAPKMDDDDAREEFAAQPLRMITGGKS